MTYLFRFEAIPQEPFEEKALRYITETDPVGLLKKCRKRGGDLKKGIRRLRWQLWIACYAGAFGIRQQPQLFQTLLEDDYFKQRKNRADLDDLLRIGLLIGTDAAPDGPTYKNACYVASRLQPLFDAAVEPMEVWKRIEAAGGLKRLDVSDVIATEDDDGADANNNNYEEGDSYNEASHDEEDEEADSDDEPDASPATARSLVQLRPSRRRNTPSRSTKGPEGQRLTKRSTAQPKQTINTSQHVMREIGDGMVILEIEVTQEMLAEVLNAAYSYLAVKRIDSEEGWQRILAVTVASSD